MKTFIVYDLDSKMPVAVGEQVSAETARYCASEITGTFHANLFAEEIDLEKNYDVIPESAGFSEKLALSLPPQKDESSIVARRLSISPTRDFR